MRLPPTKSFEVRYPRNLLIALVFHNFGLLNNWHKVLRVADLALQAAPYLVSEEDRGGAGEVDRFGIGAVDRYGHVWQRTSGWNGSGREWKNFYVLTYLDALLRNQEGHGSSLALTMMTSLERLLSAALSTLRELFVVIRRFRLNNYECCMELSL